MDIPNSSDLLEAVIQATPDAIFVKDVSGRYVLVNDAFARFIGKSPSQILGKHDLELYDLLHSAHPGGLLRAANSVLSSSVRLGPWIHVGSEVSLHGLVHDGDLVRTYGRVVDRFERKGHQFVDLDVVSMADDRPVLTARHTAIYEPRAVAP